LRAEHTANADTPVRAVAVSITSHVDEHFPGFVACELCDAHGRTSRFVEKVPVVSSSALGADSAYPQPGFIRCTVLSRGPDASGRVVARIDTAKPDGVESTEGTTIFEVLAVHLTEVGA